MEKSGWGKNVLIGERAEIGEGVVIGHNCILEDDISIGAGTFIDSNCIIRSGTRIGPDSNIGSNCILGEYWMDFYRDHQKPEHPLTIRAGALIRIPISGSPRYAKAPRRRKTVSPDPEAGVIPLNKARK